MNCSKCGNTSPITCGCETGIPTPPPCAQGTPACPDPDPCAETFDSQCIIYTGDDIVCDNTTIVETNTNISEALNSIVDYFCDTPAPASCVCLYEATVTLDKVNMQIESALFPNRVALEFPITVGANDVIEVVSASYRYNAGETGFTFFPGGDGKLFVQTLTTDVPQFTSGDAKVLETTTTGIYLMENYEYVGENPLPNMAVGESVYLVVNGVANSLGTPNATMDITITYKKTTY